MGPLGDQHIRGVDCRRYSRLPRYSGRLRRDAVMTDEQKPGCPQCGLEVSGRFCGHCGAPTLLAQPTTWQSRFLEGSHPWAIDDAYLEATTLSSLLTQPFAHIA